MALIMLGYVRYAPYQTDWDGVTYMDIASAILHGRWHLVVNAYWGPGYPALLALGKWVSHANRVQELRAFYFVNYCIVLASIACATFFVRSLQRVRMTLANLEHTVTQWAISSPLLHLATYALLFLAWLGPISPDNVRVDGLYASLLLLAFGCLLRLAVQGGFWAAAGLGFAFGAAYLVKSPAFILALIAVGALLVYWKLQSAPKRAYLMLLSTAAVFAALAGPYIVAISMQKHRLDLGDSGRLNYAWCVSATGRYHLLQNQTERFGRASVHLIHPETELLANPVVVAFPHFAHATYPIWFDPSYWNEGVQPHFSIALPFRNLLRQLHPVERFVILQLLALSALALCFLFKIRITSSPSAHRIVSVLVGIFLLNFFLFVLVHFEDRYILGPYWAAWIGTLAFLVAPQDAQTDLGFARGITLFFAISVAAFALQTVMQLREKAIWNDQPVGWFNLQELHAAQALEKSGVPPDAHLACFHACDSGAYWARLASMHVTAEIYDERYMRDAGHPAQEWRSLPNKPEILAALHTVGIPGIVGRFHTQPAEDATLPERWQHLAGDYYWLPTQAPVTQTPAAPQSAAR